MAAQTEDTPTAQMVGNAFVQQYYSILHQSPEQVHKFYQDSSVLSRPGPDGVMTSVTTMQGINDKVVSIDYKNYKVEILTADSQSSYKSGLIVLVTGCLTGKDNLRRKFSQTFFLAPQDNGYFVLNDVFRYVDESEAVADLSTPDVVESAPEAPPTPEPVSTDGGSDLSVLNQMPPLVEATNKDEEKIPAVENGTVLSTEKGFASDHSVDSSQSDVPAVTETIAPTAQEDTPKKSFASVVNALKENAAPFHMRVSPAKPVAKSVAQAQPQPPAQAQAQAPAQAQAQAQTSPAPEVSAPKSNNSVEKSNEHSVAAKGYAIFVPNLPMNATVEELEEIFTKFGSIKPDGIQVRSNRQQGSCFGFVEFESVHSLQDALQASPITLGPRKLFIEERRANNDRGRFQSGRGGGGGYRNENYRARGNFNGGRGQGKYEFGQRGEFPNRRGNVERNGDGFQRAYQNGGGRVARQAAANVAAA